MTMPDPMRASDFLKGVRDLFNSLLHKQSCKGYVKYGRFVDPMHTKWDWADMASEELLDAFVYIRADKEKKVRTVTAVIKALKEVEPALSASPWGAVLRDCREQLSTLLLGDCEVTPSEQSTKEGMGIDGLAPRAPEAGRERL